MRRRSTVLTIKALPEVWTNNKKRLDAIVILSIISGAVWQGGQLSIEEQLFSIKTRFLD